jgi:tyrosyl-tRNA synthetase
MDVESKIGLVLREPTEEVVEVQELREIFQTNAKPRHYIGLEISGKLHLGSLILTGYKINDFIEAGVQSNVFLADWHTYINNKLDNNWEKIIQVSKYYTEAFKFFCPGVNVILGSNLYESYEDYWKNFMVFSKHMTLSRTLRALTIMGRSEKEKLDFSQLMYPSMQSADIEALDLDIVHAGMDQRKIHMLVREIFPKLKWKVPVSVHHHLLPGLYEPTKFPNDGGDQEEIRLSSKMSKTNPLGSILIHDDETTISNKISKAYCPIGISENNPILEIIKYIIFHNFSEFQIDRPSKYGGNMTYDKYINLEKDYNQKKIHPKDLKDSVSIYLNRVIEPIRAHFTKWSILDDL